MSPLATELVLLLAMRGWVNPRALLPAGLPARDLARVLDEVAPVVDVAPGDRPGQWYLDDQERQRVFAMTVSLTALGGALAPRGPDDSGDPARLALELRRLPVPADLERLPDDVLKALGSTFLWLARVCPGGGFWAAEPDLSGVKARVAAAIAARRSCSRA